MPSQTPLPSDTLEPIVLPLVKYSYATVSSDHVAPLPWTHISENKLFAVFATVRIQTSSELEEQQRFRIVNDLKGAILVGYFGNMSLCTSLQNLMVLPTGGFGSE